MPHAGEIERCRDAALYYRNRATSSTDDCLRDSYLGLAAEYERLAEVLMRIKPRTGLTVTRRV